MAWSFNNNSATVGAVATSQNLAYGGTGVAAAGDLLVVAVSTYSNDTVTISDTQGNSYSTAVGPIRNPSGGTLTIFYAIAKSSGANTVTAALSVNDYLGLGILDYTPPAGTVAVDGKITATGGSTAPSCGSISVAGTGELCIAAYCANSATTITTTAGTGFTLRCSQGNPADEILGVEDALNVSTAQTGSFTVNSAVQWAAAGVSFTVTGGGATSLGLGQQSAAWVNPSATLYASMALAAESASFSNPSLGLQSLLTLAQESAAWSDPSLSMALVTALGQQSANWANPGIAIPGASLALGPQSAAWSNPALSLAAEVALAAQAAGWSNPTLARALAIVLTGQASAWTNPTITPSSGSGVVISLPSESAIFQTYPLGVVFVPRALSLNFGMEWVVINNTEGVIFYRKKSDGVFDSGTTVDHALRLEVVKEGVKVKGRLNWLLWSSEAGTVPAKAGDVVQDASGFRWVAERAHIQAWGARYFLETLQER